MPRAILLNTAEFPCPGSHLLHTRKFLNAFGPFGYEFVLIDSFEHLRDMALGPKDVVYFSNHGLKDEAMSTSQMLILEAIRSSGAFPIFWFWHEQSDLLNGLFGDRWILTGEHYRALVPLESHAVVSEAFRSSPNFVPLTFAASLSKEEINGVQKGSRWDASFVGHYYQRTLNTSLILSKAKVGIKYTPPFISEEARIRYFTDSMVVLGWHSSANASNGVVVERVFEGLAYGSVVITDNPFALEATDGNVIVSTDRHEILELIKRFKSDERLLKKTVDAGKSWVSSHGTYSSVVLNFLERISRKP
jgi:hypothetical protein